MDRPDFKLIHERLKEKPSYYAELLGVTAGQWQNIKAGSQWRTTIPEDKEAAVSFLVDKAGLNGSHAKAEPPEPEEIVVEVRPKAEAPPTDPEPPPERGREPEPPRKHAAPGGGIDWDAIPDEGEAGAKGQDEEADPLKLILAAVAPWYDDDGAEKIGYVTVAAGKTELGVPVLRHYRVRSRNFALWVRQYLHKEAEMSIGRDKLKDLMDHVEADAVFNGEPHRAWRRTAPGKVENELWLDLARPDHRVVRIDADGWSIEHLTAEAPRLIYADALGPMPLPERDPGKPADMGLDQLLGAHLNLSSDNAKAERHSRLFAAGWAIAAMRPRPPYWLAGILGEQGTGKSTATRLLKRLVDPGGAEDGHPPKSPHDLAVVAATQRVVCLDNLSKVSPEMSDALARMATGSTIQNRALYSDAGVSFTRVEAAAVLNGISDFVVRPDLAERTLSINLSRPTHRRTEKRIYKDFHDAHPHLLAVLLDGLVSVMGYADEVEEKLDPLDAPRMVDCYVWAAAAGRAWDWGPGEFLTAMREVSRDLAEAALDTPVHQALLAMLRKLAAKPDKEAKKALGHVLAKCGELVEPLRHACMDAGVSDRELEFLPSSGRGITNLLRRLAPPMRTLGWTVDYREHDGRGDDKAPRYWIEPPKEHTE